MKRLLASILSLAAVAAIVTGGSATDGDVDYGDSAGAGTTKTVTDSRTDRTYRTERDSRVTTTTRREISDDIADGINSGLDKTESVVDDILK